jgi:predicted nicotinamide N-methyase
VVQGEVGLDQVHLTTVRLVPEVRLHLAQDGIILWARLEAEAGRALPPPFWASAWAGGQALARYLLDHPQTVRGRRVLDVAAGSGLAGIAAALAGAATVHANDTDPYARGAIALNARANAVVLTVSDIDLLDAADGHGADGDAAERAGGDGDADVVIAGDVFYSKEMAERMRRFLERAVARGAQVLVGDPGRTFLPEDWLEPVATYPMPVPGASEDAQITHTHVLRPREG